MNTNYNQTQATGSSYRTIDGRPYVTAKDVQSAFGLSRGTAAKRLTLLRCILEKKNITVQEALEWFSIDSPWFDIDIKYKGVYRRRLIKQWGKQWGAHIYGNKKNIYLGAYDTKEEAFTVIIDYKAKNKP